MEHRNRIIGYNTEHNVLRPKPQMFSISLPQLFTKLHMYELFTRQQARPGFKLIKAIQVMYDNDSFEGYCIDSESVSYSSEDVHS